MRLVRFAVVGVGFVMAALPAQATVAYSNFGASLGFDLGSGYVTGAFVHQGFQFTSGATGGVSDIYVGVSDIGSGATTATFDLYSDSGSDTLGALLGTWSGAVTTTPTAQLLTGGSATLAAGSKYWLIGRDPGTVYGWHYNNQGATSRRVASVDGGSSYTYGEGLTQGAFRIDVSSPVPEPFTMGLAGLALAAAARRRLRKSA